MSADPTIPVIEDGQSLNRFSYVFNNPLSYTDPSGFTPEGEKEPVATPNPCTTKDCKDNDKKKRCLQDNDCWNGGWRSFYPEGGDSTFNGGTKAAASKGQATAADSAKGEPSQSDALTPGELLLQRIADKAALARNCSLIETGCAQAVERVYKAIEKRQALESFDKEIIEAAFFEFKAASLVLAIPLKRLAAKGVGAAARATTKGLVDLTEHRAAHILNRHRAGTGISGKTESLQAGATMTYFTTCLTSLRIHDRQWVLESGTHRTLLVREMA